MSWVWWLVGTLGVGGAIIGALFFMGLWPVIIGTKIGRVALAIGAGVLAGVGIYAQGRAKGRALERARLKALTEKEIGVSAKERARIDALPDAEVDKELSEWDRKS